MNCFHCDRPAHGVCCFCGRAICKQHFQKDNRILEIYPKRDEKGKDRVLVVEDVLKCGVCKPIENLLELELE